MTGTRRDRLYPPLAGNSDSDHSGWIVVANALGLVLALITLGVRFYIRATISPPAKRDDGTASLATAVGFVQALLVFFQIDAGLGKTIDDLSAHSVDRVQKLGYASDPFYIAALFISKVSMMFLLIRITVDQKHQHLLSYGLAICGVLALISVLLVLTTCHISHPWRQFGEACGDIYPRWQAITAFDVATELGLFLVPVAFLAKLQMKINKKLKVIFAFSTRLPLVAFSIVRLYHIHEELKSSNPTLAGALAAVWTQTEMHYALIATTLPCVTPFLSSVSTGYMASGTLEMETLSGSGQGNSREMSSRKQSHNEAASAVEGPDDEDHANSEAELRPRPDLIRASILCARRNRDSTESTQRFGRLSPEV